MFSKVCDQYSMRKLWFKLFSGVVIEPIPFSLDNYGYLVVDEQDAVSILIDPADPDTIQVSQPSVLALSNFRILNAYQQFI